MTSHKYLQYRENDWNLEDIEERVLRCGSVKNRKPYMWVWKDDSLEEELYADERRWITDIFEPTTTQSTEERDRYPKFAPKRPNRSSRKEELQVGDTTQLDSFLAGFMKQEVSSV